jgi:hypothetical protein
MNGTWLIAGALGILIIAGLLIWWRRSRSAPEEAFDEVETPEDAEARHRFAQRRVELAVIARQKGWSEAAYEEVLYGRIGPGMNQEMVLLAWGGPTSIDHKTVTRKGAPVERWIYQLPQAALPSGMTSEVQYVWFANGRVARVEEGA